MSRLEELCRPFLMLVCANCCYERAGAGVNPAELKARAHAQLQAIRAKCETDPVLRREFERIEKPLVFFADYCLKDGDTALARSWTELGREYNELSGDEKFFDMLLSTLEDPDASERLRLFYVMLGLGFDGVHRGDGEFVQRRMKLCATRFTAPEPAARNLYPDVSAPFAGVMRRRSRVLSKCLIGTLVFIACAFAYNYYRFCYETRAYATALFTAHDLALRPEKTAVPAEGEAVVPAVSASGEETSK